MRPLPWRETRDPYAIWVSEVMLQQTRVETVVGYWGPFMDRFPALKILAAAPEDAVFKAWEGLGYYRRARNLHRGAQYLVEKEGGVFPATLEGLLKVPGIGAYTAGAIGSIAFGWPVAAVDGNVLRVLSRLYGLCEPVENPSARRLVSEMAAGMIPEGRSWAHNQGLMELGALVCVPKTPRCGACPLASSCVVRARGSQCQLPVRSPRKKQRVEHIAIVVVVCGGKVLIQKRRGGLLDGMWGFPALALLPGEEPAQTAKAWAQALPLDMALLADIHHARHTFTHIIWEMTGIRALAAECVSLPEGYLWVEAGDLARYAIPAAFRPFIGWAMESVSAV